MAPPAIIKKILTSITSPKASNTSMPNPDAPQTNEPTAGSCLPTELVEEILLHLDAKDILKLRMVCKFWYNVIAGSTKLTTKISFHMMSRQARKPYLQFIGGRVEWAQCFRPTLHDHVHEYTDNVMYGTLGATYLRRQFPKKFAPYYAVFVVSNEMSIERWFFTPEERRPAIPPGAHGKRPVWPKGIRNNNDIYHLQTEVRQAYDEAFDRQDSLEECEIVEYLYIYPGIKEKKVEKGTGQRVKELVCKVRELRL